MLYALVMVVHVIVSLVLIFVILLQAGRGGGLSEAFGGSSTQTIFGTKTSLFLRRATEVSAIVYILTCLSLAVMTSHRGRSLVGAGLMRPLPQAQGQTGVPMPQPLPNEPIDY